MSDDATPDAGTVPAAPAERPFEVRQLRLVVTADDYDAAVAFYRDALGLPEIGAFADPDGRIVILDAGRATLEIADPPHAAYVDRVENVDRPAGPTGARRAGLADAAAGPRIRVAFEVTDAQGATRRLAGAGGEVVAEPVRTPWGSLNSRLDAPAGLEVTLFQEVVPET
jgi:lactoylglutathione lyase